jgi:serine/threonine protein kinase
MVFELMAGSLYDIIDKGKYSNGLEFKLVKNIMYQLIVAMDVLNNKLQLLHTDIKPENILIHGISNKTQDIINEFNQLNFTKFYNKKKTSFKKKKREKMLILMIIKKLLLKNF